MHRAICRLFSYMYGTPIHIGVLSEGLTMVATLNFNSVKFRNPLRNFCGLESDGTLSVCLGLEESCPSGGGVVGKACLKANNHTIILR